MRLRVTGLADEVAQAVELLAGVFDVVDVSTAYPCRGRSDLVRVYVEVRLGSTRSGRGASADVAAVSGGRAGAELETAPTRPATTTTADERRWMR